jgi:hypothetical protein
MATVKKRLAGPALVTNTAATKYTCPALTTAVIRRIRVDNPSAGAVTFTMSIGADAAGTRLFGATSIPANSGLDIWGPFTLAAAEIVQALAGTTNVLTLTIDGEEIT